MHRYAARRLLHSSSSSSSLLSFSNKASGNPIRIPPFRFLLRFVSSEAPPPPRFSDQGDTHSRLNTDTYNTSAEGRTGTPPRFSDQGDDSRLNTDTDNTSATGRRRNRFRANYEEEQARVLAASLNHVIKLGWSEAAMIAGARDVSISPSIVGSIPRKEAALVEYFMDDCLQKLIDIIDSGELRLHDLVLSDRIAILIKLRLQMQAPYISKWPQALSIQAQPSNLPTSFKQRAMLVDEFWHASNNQGTGVDWYLKRTLVGGIYSAAEIYMLTDNSTDFEDTWKFLNERVRDAFDLEKTFQEVKYFAEAVGAGLGGSLQGFTKKGY